MKIYLGDSKPKFTNLERARLYVAKAEPSISGEQGSNKCFSLACRMFDKFCLSKEEAYQVMWEDWNPRCQPPWTEKELRHKIESAIKKVGGLPPQGELPPWERNGATEKTAPPPTEGTIGLLGELMARLRRGEGDILYDAGEVFGGFECGPGKVTVLGAPPGAGKTAITMQYVFGLLETDPSARVVIANAEMSFDVLMRRELTRRSGVPGKALRFADLNEQQMASVEAAASSLVPLLGRLEVMKPPYTMETLNGLLVGGEGRLLVVDYLQKFSASDDPRIGVNMVMGSLRTLAHNGWGVLALSSVTRIKKGESLSMSSFKESGEIEFNADACYLLRDEGASGGDERVRNSKLDNVKNRHGEMLSLEMVFDMPHMTFTPRIKPHDFGMDEIDDDDDDRRF